MQIVCPNCSARYAVDPSAIGPHGRTVQCSRCGHRWVAHVEAEEPLAPADSVHDQETVPEVMIRPQNHESPVPLPAVREVGMPTWLKISLGVVVVVGLIGGASYALARGLSPFVVADDG